MRDKQRRTESNSGGGISSGRAPGKQSLVEKIMRKVDHGAVNAGAGDAVANASQSSGVALPDGLRWKFETSLDTSLADVRVNTGSDSQAAAASLGARAYATDQDIHFGAGQYDPKSTEGERLIAHEVAHTVQARGGGVGAQCKLEVSTPGDSHEVEADRAADAMVVGERASVSASGASPVSRKVSSHYDGMVTRLSYSVTDWAVTDEEAVQVLAWLYQLSILDFNDTIAQLRTAGLLERLASNLDTADAAELHRRMAVNESQADEERALDGQLPWTQVLAERVMARFTGLSAAERQSWVTRVTPRGQVGPMVRALSSADTTVGGRFHAPLQDLLSRTQLQGALQAGAAQGLANQDALATEQANHMIAQNTAAATAAQAPGTTAAPTAAEIAAQQKAQVSQTSIAPQVATLTPEKEKELTTKAEAAVTVFVAWVKSAHPELPITKTNFQVKVREVFDRGDGIIAFAGAMVGGVPTCVVGESFTMAATANPAYALPTVVHELWGHNDYGAYGAGGVELGLTVYDQAAAKMPGYTQPTGDARTSELDAYAYQETEIYSLMREVPYYTPNAPKDTAKLDSINYDPAPTISSRIGLMKQQFAPKVAISLAHGLYQRFKIDPRLDPKALKAFEDGVRQNFSAAEAATILT